MKLTRKEAIAVFDTDVEDGALYGRSHEAFEQWCEDNDVELIGLVATDTDNTTKPVESAPKEQQ